MNGMANCNSFWMGIPGTIQEVTDLTNNSGGIIC